MMIFSTKPPTVGYYFKRLYMHEHRLNKQFEDRPLFLTYMYSLIKTKVLTSSRLDRLVRQTGMGHLIGQQYL